MKSNQEKTESEGSSSDILIRLAVPEDINEIAEVLHSAYNISSIEEAKKVFISETSKGIIYLVAEKNNKILGITTFIIHGLPKHGLAELDRIAVLPEFRGGGIGKKLFNGLIDELKKYYKQNNCSLRKLYLLTHKDNEVAQSFYKKLGLNHETTLKSHYYKDKDEYVFSILFD